MRGRGRPLRTAIDDRVRGLGTVAALLSRRLLSTRVRALDAALSLGRWTLPLLAVAGVPLVVGVIDVWSIDCDVCH